MSMFKKATKSGLYLKAALLGPAGSGKSYSALAIACAIAEKLGKRVAAIDTERGSLSKYSDIFDFDVITPKSFEPNVFINALTDAVTHGYGVAVIDSLSHAWMGTGGILELHDEAARRNRGDSFGAWREATPEHNRLVDAMLNAEIHLIATMRTKMEHIIEQDDRGKNVVRKVGMAPVQRGGLEYEFDIISDMDSGVMTVSKTRCPAMSGKSYKHPGADVAAIMLEWAGAAPERTPTLPQESEIKTRYKAACATLGITPQDAMKELLSWHEVASVSEINAEQFEGFVVILEGRVRDLAEV